MRETDAKQAAKERVINAKHELDRLRTERTRGDVQPEKAEEHRKAEDTAVAELEAAKVHWHQVDPENAPDPKSPLYIYP